MPRPAVVRATRASASDNAARILRVAERLFAERGFRGTTVRAIAQAAHVAHPLIYHYFGSKHGLLAAVLEKTQSRMRATGSRGGRPSDVAADLMRENLTGSRLYVLTLTRALADGMRPADWPGGFPTVEAVLGLLTDDWPDGARRPSEIEARELLAVAVSMAVGWALLEDQVLEIVGLSATQRDEARELVVSLFVDMLRPVLPPGRA